MSNFVQAVSFQVKHVVCLCRFPVDVSGRGRRLRVLEPAGLDRPSDGAQKTQTLLQVPNPRTRERVPLQRLRVEAKEVGVGAESEPDREASEDMVPEQTNEEQEELAAAGGAGGAEQQQQLEREQPQPPRRAPPRTAPRGIAPRAAAQAPSVTRALLWDLPPSPRYS